MITPKQYIEIINACEKYIKLYTETTGKDLSRDYVDGFTRALDIVKTLVKE